MKRERTLNLAWPLVVLLAVLLVGGGAWGVGAILFEDPATRKSYPNKTVAGFLGTTSGTVDIQTMPQPTEGEVLTAGCGTSSATSTNTASCARFRPATSGSGLPSGTPGQVAGIKTVTVSTTTTGTATATASATAYQAVNGTLYAGSNVTLSKGTDTNTSSAVDLADSPRIHAASAAYSFSTVTPAAVGTSGSVGTSTLLPRADHVHQGDGNDKVSPWDGVAPGTLLDVMMSGDGSIGLCNTCTPLKLDLRANFGTAENTVCEGNDSRLLKVSAFEGYTPGYLYDTVFSSTGSITVGLNSQKLNLTANFGTTANTVCQGNDSRLSNARTPTAHASTHVTGGTDVIPNAVASGNAGLMTGADKAKLDSTTTTPTAYSIPATGSTQYLNAWIQAASASVAGLLSTAHYNLINGATATPTASRIPIADGSGTLNSWVNGQLISSTKYTTNALLSATGAAWSVGYTTTFSTTGTKFRVRAKAILDSSTTDYRVCGLAIVADSGSSASTIKDAWWTGATYYNNFYSTVVASRYFVGVVEADATFTLSAGTVTIGLAMYRMAGSGYCESSSGAAAMYVDIYD